MAVSQDYGNDINTAAATALSAYPCRVCVAYVDSAKITLPTGTARTSMVHVHSKFLSLLLHFSPRPPSIRFSMRRLVRGERQKLAGEMHLVDNLCRVFSMHHW